ncbi:hypothetical protein [Endozoicomonas sp. 8E]|uniref:hypothetical protein n=1 Tax=Endozoicomonas sp. 8E TaxID=3035692 RepID=UPI0029390581|nr:hypothetical protein [Endozoicomonas sp. 8E]WOG30150.1 hypothetical protein P6910_11005 [Endozoicomonas sp. 8E]
MITKRIVLLLLTVTYKIFAQPGDCYVVTNEDLLLTEHVESLHRNRVPYELRPQIEQEVITIIGNSIRKTDPALSEEDINDRAKRWLQEALDEMEREDREDLHEHYEQNNNNDTDEGFFEYT